MVYPKKCITFPKKAQKYNIKIRFKMENAVTLISYYMNFTMLEQKCSHFIVF